MDSNIAERITGLARTIVVLLRLLLAGCSNPSKELFRQALKSYPEWWTKPEQLASLRKLHSILEDYNFVHLELIGYARAEEMQCDFSSRQVQT